MHYDQAIEVSSFFFAVALLSSSLTASAQRDKIDHCLHQHFDFATLTHFYTSLLIIPINLLFNFCKCKGLPPATPPPPLSHSLPPPSAVLQCCLCCCLCLHTPSLLPPLEGASSAAVKAPPLLLPILSPSRPPHYPLSHSLPCLPHRSAVLLPPRMDAVVTCQSWPMIDM